MILQFKVKNFLSIREEQTLDFTASADKPYIRLVPSDSTLL